MTNFRQIDENPLFSMCDDLRPWDAFDYLIYERNMDKVTRETNRLKLYDTILVHNEVEIGDEVQGCDISPSVSDSAHNTSFLKLLKERVNQGKEVFRGNAVYCLDKMKKYISNDETPHTGDITQNLLKNEKYPSNILAEYNAQEENYSCTEVVKVISLNEVRYDKNINVGINRKFSEKSEKRTNFKQFPFSKVESMRDPLNSHKIRNIETLEDSLKYFNLSSCLQQLENSLEDVRRNKKTREDHDDCFKQIDKVIQKLSFKYHPDRVRNKGGTEKDIIIAQKLQTAINSTRTALKFLNAAFIDDIGTIHKFGFYINLSIDSLSNEDEIKQHIYEVILEIGMISQIKQKNIISEIRKFLIESEKCIISYLGDRVEFEKYRDSALFQLKCCIEGFKTLIIKLEKVKEQYKAKRSCQNRYSIINSMENETKSNLKILQLLSKMVETSLKGKFKLFQSENMDSYYVLPLVCYANVILMCDVMMRGSRMKLILDDRYRKEQLTNAIHSHCNGEKLHEEIMLQIIAKIQRCSKFLENKEEYKFYISIVRISKFMECAFKVENYNVTITTDLNIVDLEKCMTMMTEFQEKQEELSKDINEFKKVNKEMEEKYERFDEILETTEDLNQKIKERLEKSKILSEKVFSALSR